MINYLNKSLLSKLIITNKLKSYYKKKFNGTNSYPTKSKILIEFNAFHSYHIPVSYFANYLKNKYKCKLIAYFNYKIISSPFKENFINEIKWKLGNFFNIKNFGIFKSFGTNKIIKPNLNNEQIKNSNKIFNKLREKIFSKKDVLNIEINGITIGDLVYDTYIKSKSKPTVLLDNEFYELLNDFCKLFIFWKTYFEENEIKAIVGVHTSYSFGIPIRIALKNNIPSYTVTFRKINKISDNMRFMSGEFINYKKNFLNIDNNLKTKGVELATKKLNYRTQGGAGVGADIISSEISSFGDKFLKREIVDNDKTKIVIFPHDFFDAVHAYGDMLFEDFYEWLEYLGKISRKTDYDWYIKNRPNYPGKFKIYQPHTEKVIDEFLIRYKNIKKLPNNYPHNQIAKEGVNCVLTAYGSVGVEYAMLNIPVINASKNNPHCNYNFNLNPKTIEEYEKLILNIDNIKLEIKKSEIYEYYFMRHIYNVKNWLINDLVDFMNFVGGWSNMNSVKFYDYWLKNVNQKKEEELNHIFENFIKSNDDAINISHMKVKL